LWAAYNAIPRLEDYKVNNNETDATRLDRVWFGGGAANKLIALEKATQFIGSN